MTQPSKVLCMAILAGALMLLPRGAKAQSTSGTLKVTSFPVGANVSVDGVDTGKVTPMTISLTVGTHAVVVSIPNSGWNPDTRTVEVVAGNNDLSVTLLPTLTTGPPGLPGAPGAAATIQIGSTTTLGPNGQASVTNVGTPNAAVLNFAIPQGQTGAAGPGGAAATVTVGTTATGLPGTSALVTNAGSSSAALLNFVIPQGPQGIQGPPGQAGPSGPASGTQVFGAGSYTIVIPDGVSHVVIEAWGAGGGGGAATGGASGGYVRTMLQIVPGAILNAIVGAGGAPSSMCVDPSTCPAPNPAPGQNGGDTAVGCNIQQEIPCVRALGGDGGGPNNIPTRRGCSVCGGTGSSTGIILQALNGGDVPSGQTAPGTSATQGNVGIGGQAPPLTCDPNSPCLLSPTAGYDGLLIIQFSP